MANSKKKKTPKISTFQVSGKPPKGKTRRHFVVAVYPEGHVGMTRAEKGDDLEGLYENARDNAEIDDDAAEDVNERDIAYYRVELVLTKPVVTPTKPPKNAHAKTSKMSTPAPVEPEPNNEGVVEPEEHDDEDDDEDEADED